MKMEIETTLKTTYPKRASWITS